ncbi:MAG: Gfo/Idh/MocA family oxidoreductase [Gammaproteobacteria bacterium]|nr:Gfo/Idh/MocA family oxidoreductase [Gammaproteobacteria bacterium]
MKNSVLIVGLGQIGLQYDLHLERDEFTYTHSRAFSKHKDFELLGAVDSDKERRSVFLQTYNLPAYNDLSEALQNHRPDVVIIATTTQTHVKIHSEVLKFSTPKIILCEKPLSYHLHEAQEMVTLSEQKGVKLYVNYMRRSDIGVIEVKNLLKKNELNTNIKGVCWYSKGFIHNGSHFFNLLEYWLGPMKQFRLININKQRISDEDYEPDVEVEFKKGSIVFLSAWEEYFSHYTIELLSPSGRIRYEEEGRVINIQNVVSDPIFKDYKILDTDEKNIVTDMQHSQLNVANQIAKSLNEEPSYLCSGKEALITLTSMQLIIDEIQND